MEMPRRPATAEKAGLVSCLCVTEDRPAFMPWLLWNYEKQDFPNRELVVVDGSSEPLDVPGRDDVTIVHCPPGASVGYKRNLAVEAAGGHVLTWFDDDDWQHPRKLSLLVEALGGDAALAGSRKSWFVDLATGRARPHESVRAVLFNGLAVRRDATAEVRFDEKRSRAADTAWMAAVRRRTRAAPVVLGELLSFWLCHSRNLSNPSSRYTFPRSIDAVRDAAGRAEWGETSRELAALRQRVEDVDSRHVTHRSGGAP
jgi:hypothetical protein